MCPRSDSDPDRRVAVASRIAIIGYGPEGRAHALRLRARGHRVSVGVRAGGMSWLRAVDDGFCPRHTASAVTGADVVMLLVPDDEQPGVYANAVAARLTALALVVVQRPYALYTGALQPRDHDVVFVADGGPAGARVAVHHDATGRALERAVAHARAVCDDDAAVATTTLEQEVAADFELLEARPGGLEAFLSKLDSVLLPSSPEPDCARLLFYERMRDVVAARVASRARPSGLRPLPLPNDVKRRGVA